MGRVRAYLEYRAERRDVRRQLRLLHRVLKIALERRDDPRV